MGQRADQPDQYAVMGNPIAHSRSPRIHTLFATQTGQSLNYRAILVPLGGFATAVAEFIRAGGNGLNVTVPFKTDAWNLSDTRSSRAARAGAVNTLLIYPDGTTSGDTTDGVGLVRDLLVNQGMTLRDRRLLLLGAGGAARGVLAALLEQAPAEVIIANRTPERAIALAQSHADLGTVSGRGFSALAGESFDAIINATSAGLDDAVPPLPDALLRPDAWCYDMMYGATPTAFVRWARVQGVTHAMDGLGMLVEQAAEAFFLWRGVRPATAPVLRALRAA